MQHCLGLWIAIVFQQIKALLNLNNRETSENYNGVRYVVRTLCMYGWSAVRSLPEMHAQSEF
jgi:hypothetical protein